LDPKDCYIHPVGIPLSEKPKKETVLLLNLQDFIRNSAVLNSKSYEKTRVFLFCAPFRAVELSNNTVLDSVQDPEEKFKFQFTKLSYKSIKNRLKETSETSKRDPEKYLYALVEDLKEGSFLTPLLTFIYTLPKSTHQTPVKEAVVMCVWSGKKLLDSLKERGVSLSDKQFEKLDAILKDKGQPYREALKFFREKRKIDPKYAIKNLEKLYAVQAYEIAYLRKIKESLKTYGKNAGKTTLDISGKKKK
jgi:hypothetical protein